ncbi:MAG: dTDP-4-dehydrorhamnose reductase [Pseudomonadota bacterium]
MILVIGQTGQVAQALAEQAPGARFLGRDALDLTETARIAPTIAEARPSVVINAAAFTAVDRAEDEPALAHQVNATAVGEIARGAAEAGAALLHLSTDYVYPGTRTGPHREDDPTGPLGVYGASKLAGEEAALAANPRTVVLRTAWVYAPWGANFVRTMLRLGAERDRLTIVADQHGQPTSALDIAAACLHAAPRLAETPAGDPLWGVYHLAGRGETTWAGFAEAVFNGAVTRGLLPRAPEVAPIPTSAYPTKATRPANSTLDCARFERAFGWPMRDWRGSLGVVLDRLAA